MSNSKWGVKTLAEMDIEKLYISHHAKSRPSGSGFCRVHLITVVILSLIMPIFFFSTFQRSAQQVDDPQGNVRVLPLPQQNFVIKNTLHAREVPWKGVGVRPIGRGTLGYKQQNEDGWHEDEGDTAVGNVIQNVVSGADKVSVGEKPEKREAAADGGENGGADDGDGPEIAEERKGDERTVAVDDGHAADEDDDGNPSGNEDRVALTKDGTEKEEAETREAKSNDEEKSGATDELATDVVVDGPTASERRLGVETRGTTPGTTITTQPTDNDGVHPTPDVRPTVIPGSHRSDLIVRIQTQISQIEELLEFARERDNSYLISHLQLQKERCLQAVQKLTDGSFDIDGGRNVARVAELATLRVRDLRKSTLKIDKLKVEMQEIRDRCNNYTDRMKSLLKERNILDLVAAKSLPKGLHCLSMQLTVAYYTNQELNEPIVEQDVLEDNSRHHYALFSDNVLAASVVIKSAISNAHDPSNHVFHLVTDSMNKPAMKAWFMLHPPHPAVVEIKTVDDFSEWLTPERCPVLKFLSESKALREFYNDVHGSAAAGGKDEDEKGIKHRNPKYLSMLNHLRFYLPEIFPKLKKVVFLDDDIVIQKDLAPLFDIDLEGNVNGAVFTCRGKFHRLGHYLNFSHPDIAREFDEDACGWAYGMNIFDLDQWRKENLTAVYHKWQIANENRLLWKLGTLPPGLLTFYKRTHPLKKSWHQLGLGYDPEVTHEVVEKAAVVHYNGNSKPWLDIAMEPYRKYWTRYVDGKDPLISECNINVGKQSSS